MGVTFERQQLANEALMLRRELDTYDEWAPAYGRRRLKQLEERLSRLERKLEDPSI